MHMIVCEKRMILEVNVWLFRRNTSNINRKNKKYFTIIIFSRHISAYSCIPEHSILLFVCSLFNNLLYVFYPIQFVDIDVLQTLHLALLELGEVLLQGRQVPRNIHVQLQVVLVQIDRQIDRQIKLQEVCLKKKRNKNIVN